VTGNTTTGYGGGVANSHVEGICTATLTNCTISGNTARFAGGVFTGDGVTLSLTNCTISGNSATTTGGGLYMIPRDTPTLINTIIAGNTATKSGPDVSGTVISLGSNLVGQTNGSTGWVGTDLTGTTASPLDPLLAPLGNYGGPTQTMALRPGSPAIDAGKSTAPPRTDQRGLNRLGSVDIGAFESQGFTVTTLVNDFVGLDHASNQGYEPPDTCGAIGPVSYVETVNQSVALYGRDGKPIVAPVFFDTFLFQTGGLPHASLTSSLGDSIVVYDEQIGRFIVGDMDFDITNHVCNFDLAVSKTSTPASLSNADWNFYSIVSNETGFDADYPGNFGFNHDAFVFTLDMFPFDSVYSHTQIMSVNHADLLNGVASPGVFKYDLTQFNLRPTTMHDSVAGDPMWFVSEHDRSSIDVIRMMNPLSSSPEFETTTLAVKPYSWPLPPLNPDGTVITDLIDSRIYKSAESGGTIVASHNVAVSANEDDAQWYAIDVSSGTPKLKDQGRVGSGPNTYTIYPGIDINAVGQIGISYMKSGTNSSTDYLSMYITERDPLDTAGTMRTPALVPSGTGQATYKGQRAGDLSGISIDPINGSFWAANEFANNEDVDNWGTAVAHFSVTSGNTAFFIHQDDYTQGDWKAVYGADGYNVSQDYSSNNPKMPAYASVNFSNAAHHVWSNSTTNVRALQQAADLSKDRIAGTWYNAENFSIDIHINDCKSHQVALYALDWSSTVRAEMIEVIDDLTGTVLDTRSLASFHAGTYLVWNISGNVTFRITNTNSTDFTNAVLSGLFFGGAPAHGGQAGFVMQDNSTQGDWKKAYGADGFSVSQDSSINNPKIPSYASVSFSNAADYGWSNSTTDVRALQKAANPSTDRIAGTWYNTHTFSIDIQIHDGRSHQVALYALDWSSKVRAETIELIDNLTGAVLDTRLLAGFHNGSYLVWNIAGNVSFRITNSNSKDFTNAVISGLFFGGAPANTSQAAFLAQDTSTQGHWKGKYGADGFDISQDTSANNPSFPSYAQVSLSSNSNAVWSSSTSDLRALLKAAPNATAGTAGAWFSNQSFSVSVKLNDGQTHRVSLYVVDWDSNARSEMIQVIDNATGAVLDTRSLSNFHDGVYLSWNIKGSVTFKVTNTGPSNAVLSGLFFGEVPVSSGSASFVTQDNSTQGSWKGVYGSGGFDISRDPSANNPGLPSYAAVDLAQSTFSTVWNPSTSDLRGLQKSAVGSTDRLAAGWYSNTSFSVGVNITDGQTHQVTLYAVDWDNASRTEMIQVIDTATGKVLDSRSIASFRNGVYLVWNVTGNVTFKVVNTSSTNAVLSGLFFA